MKTYKIEVVGVPQEFVISANNEMEAKTLSKSRFSKNNNVPIQESNVLEESKEF